MEEIKFEKKHDQLRVIHGQKSNGKKEEDKNKSLHTDKFSTFAIYKSLLWLTSRQISIFKNAFFLFWRRIVWFLLGSATFETITNVQREHELQFATTYLMKRVHFHYFYIISTSAGDFKKGDIVN